MTTVKRQFARRHRRLASVDMVPAADDLERARRQGDEDARTAGQHAPDDAALRIAWALGFGAVDQIQEAVTYAREKGLGWPDIAQITGEPDRRAAESRYGRGAERQRRYRARKKGES